tara:strand:- start:1174 stop:1836 length:663 start_codon:yes stop_codon:yes gene_type:complete
MTYLQAINKVLRRLREDEVASPDTNAYSKLIGEFINDATRLVEDSWDWSQLRRTLYFNTVVDQRYYPLTDLNFQYKTISVIDNTNQVIYDVNTQENFLADIFTEGTGVSDTTGQPSYYANTGYDTNAEFPEIAFYPLPDAVYRIRMTVVDRSDEYTLGTDVIKAPSLPIVQFAQAMAVEERGETGGTTSATLMGLARSTLSDAIAMDVARFPTETIWREV